MICDNFICDILLLYVLRRSFRASFALLVTIRVLTRFEVFKGYLWDFSELGNSFEKSGDIFEILEVNQDSG